MKFSFATCAFILLICLPKLYSQSDYRKGFIITSSNDTLYGEVDYRSNTRKLQICKFKKDDRIFEYSPSQLLEYGFIGDKQFTTQIVDNYFVEVIIRGELSLYKYDSYLYIQKKGGIAYLLDNKEIKVESDGEDKYMRTNKWLGIILSLTSECDQVTKNTQRITYSENNIVKLVVAYNQCIGNHYTDYQVNKPWAKTEYGAVVGLVQSVLEIKKQQLINLNYLNKRYFSLNPSLGINLTISSPRLNECIALQTGIYIDRASFSSLINTKDANSTKYYDTFVKYTALSLPISLKYSLSNRKYPVFLYTGIELIQNIHPKTYYTYEVVTNSTVKTYEERGFSIQSSSMGYIGGIGIRKTLNGFNAELSLNYQIYNLHKTQDLKVNVNKFSISLIFYKK